MLESSKGLPLTHLPYRHVYSEKATGLGGLGAKESSCSGQLQGWPLGACMSDLFLQGH